MKQESMDGVLVLDGRFRVFRDGSINKVINGVETSATVSYSGEYPVVYNKGPAYVHKLIAEAFLPNPSKRTQVNHIDGNKGNYSVENLEWVTPSENMSHAYKTGLTRGRLGVKKRDYSASKSPILRNISKKCEESGMSFCEVERTLGIGNGVIARWERSSPTVEKLKAVADYFGVTIDWLLSDAPEQK